jgi:predicted DNA-binding transcriptional regulator AlpA
MRAPAQAVYLTAADLRERYRCSRMWITRRIKQSNFPGPVKLGGRVGSRRRWKLADVEAWEAEQRRAS